MAEEWSIRDGVLERYLDKERHVVLPTGIREIGRSAFYRNYNLETIVLPDGVTAIGEGAFSCCYKLKSVVLPGSVAVIGRSAFSHCLALESVAWAAGLKTIDDGAFTACRSLKSAALPDSLTFIGKGAFSGCVGLESVRMPDSVTRIGESAFSGCSVLRLACEPNCVPQIGENAFRGVDPRVPRAFKDAQARNIPLYSGRVVTVTNLRRHRNADRLQCTQIDGHNVIVGPDCRIGQRLVYFPAGGQLDEAFARENHLLRWDEMGNVSYALHPVRRNITFAQIRGEVSEGLALPVEALAKYADVASLQDGDRICTLNGHPLCRAYIPDEMDLDIREKTLVRYRSAKNAPQTVYVPWGTEVIAAGAFMRCSRVAEVVLPETVTEIGSRAFYCCRNLKKVVLPESVVRIGDEAFAHCDSLTDFTLPKHLKQSARAILDAADFVISNGTLTKYKGDAPAVVIPEGVTEIGNAAFRGNRVIERVTIPPGVVKIGRQAFRECRRLRSVSIPESVKAIGDEAFFECKSLRDVTVPASVEKIGDHAFGVYFYFRYIEGFKFPHEEYRKYEGFRMHCKAGSVAERYARENRLTCFTAL